MTSDVADTPTANEYELVCNDCTFETSVEGSFLDALDVADEHQEEYGGTPTDHFVDLEVSRTP